MNLILSDYEAYYEMRFDRKPKLVRKIRDGEENSRQVVPKDAEKRRRILKEKNPAATSSPITGLQAENVTAHTPTNNQSIIDCLVAVNKRSEFLYDKAISHNMNVQVNSNEHNQQLEYARLLLSTPTITDNHIKLLEMFKKK